VATQTSQPDRLTADRLAFETLISDTSALLMGASPQEVNPAIEAALERVRVFFGADRCGILKVTASPDSAVVTHAAYGPGIPRVPPSFEVAKLFPWTHHRVTVEHTPVMVSRMSDLPAEAAVDRAAWEKLGARSSVVVPVLAGATVTHLILIAMLRGEREWPVDYVPRLRVLGELMANAVLRAQAFESLQSALEEVKRLRDRLERENVYLRKEVASREGPDLVSGRSPAIRHALELARQVAATTSTVLLVGETGTGKERFATYIHQHSPRRDRHMVRVNCSAIPGALIESELFGREKGAYTGALSKQIGRFELAQGSTLFLDEIGDLPLDVQVKLLRVLQERTIERLGSPVPIAVDVRIIAATNRDLDAAVREGTFRSDLYYRLNVFPIVVPPLRERREDIPVLVEMLVDELGASMRKRIDSVDRASLEALARYDWPGNIRELRNVLERAMIISPQPTLVVAPPVTHVTAAPGATRVAGRDLRNLEREHILQVLEETGWRIRGKGGAAQVLGLKPTTLEGRMERLGIRRPGTHVEK